MQYVSKTILTALPFSDCKQVQIQASLVPFQEINMFWSLGCFTWNASLRKTKYFRMLVVAMYLKKQHFQNKIFILFFLYCFSKNLRLRKKNKTRPEAFQPNFSCETGGIPRNKTVNYLGVNIQSLHHCILTSLRNAQKQTRTNFSKSPNKFGYRQCKTP